LTWPFAGVEAIRILTGTILQLSNEDAASGSGDWFDRMATLRYTTASAIA
jgi:hypothetical protein